MELASNQTGTDKNLAAFEQAIAQIRQRQELDHHEFAQWFSSVQFNGLQFNSHGAGVVVLAARNEFVREWVQKKFEAPLVEALQGLLGRQMLVQWVVGQTIETPVYQPPTETGETKRPGRLRIDERRSDAPPASARRDVAEPVTGSFPTGGAGAHTNAHGGNGQGGSGQGGSGQRPHPSSSDSSMPVRGMPYIPNTRREQLIDKHTFKNFVVGPSNELAYAAAIAAAGGGGPRYNPLFICGPTGLGKTHLMHAIALKVLDDRPDACVLYVSAEHFTNQFIGALQHHSMEAFRKRYRQECDLLLVDDIQFLAGREQTQEEFFHTFNSLHDFDKPIVVSSDKYPQDLQKMPERLISRFNSGLVADIQTPALETRVAIVRKKAALEGIPLGDDVAVLLAQTFKSNVRELEGSLIRLAAKSSLMGGQPITLEFARNEISVVAQRLPEVRSVADIQSAVCGHFRVTNDALLSKDRHKSVAFARQVAMYLCRQRLKCSFPELGRAFGNRDHTTVMSAVRRVEALRQQDPAVNAHLEAIETKLSTDDN